MRQIGIVGKTDTKKSHYFHSAIFMFKYLLAILLKVYLSTLTGLLIPGDYNLILNSLL